MQKLRETLLAYIRKVDWLPGLAARLALGITFMGTGWGKLHHLDKVIAYFTQLGIPAAQIQAPFVAGVELICGTLLVLGLLTRLASFPLICSMTVAILTAKRGDIHEINDLLFMPEFLCIILLLWLIVKGAGAVSLDKVLTTTKESS